MDFFARWRVRIGYFLAVLVLWLARPAPKWIFVGGAVGLLGLAIRAYAAGYLHKQEILTVSGPYAYTRNPLYFGSSILTAGAAIAMHSVWSAALLLIYFALVYSFVMRREEMELRRKHGAAFDEYSSRVTLFFPWFPSAPQSNSQEPAFSWARYKKNHEYQALGGFLLLLIALAVIWRLRGT